MWLGESDDIMLNTRELTEKEILNYRRKGITYIEIDTDDDIYVSGCNIPLKFLDNIAPIGSIRYKERVSLVEITIASKGLKNIPESAIKLEHDKKIDSLEVRVWHKHQRYLKEIKLGLIYNGSE